ncbi:hypothetical protein PG991_010488 [Apiospora marii]|uniref:Heterokaryon incompatibility domain-containing protein n=1 Tax=Apiospora marii TaxID=335849 RepID=A0ABR1RIV1_9PEZI
MEPSSNVLCRRCREIDLGKALSEWSEGRKLWDYPKLCYVSPEAKEQGICGEANGETNDGSCFLCDKFPNEPGWLCSMKLSPDFTGDWFISDWESLLPAAVQLAYQPQGLSSPSSLDLICVNSGFFSASFRIDLVLQWLHDCRTHHDCGKVHSATLAQEIKLIDCHKLRTVPSDGSETYVALSYVWGDVARGELDALHKGQLPARLPHTVGDAILVTKMLGFRYLWVDAYCIDNASSSTLHEQMGQMDAIYGRAQLTLVAAAGEDAESGLPGVRFPYGPYLKHEDICLVQSQRIHPRNSINASRWSTRGWTYQEAVLACRRLVFTREHVYFECTKMSCWRPNELRVPTRNLNIKNKEDLPLCSPLEPPIVWRPFPQANLEKYIFTSITEYTQRQLTYESDSLNGFQGILSHYRELTGGDVLDLWGIPYKKGKLYSMLYSLCWYHDKHSYNKHGVHIRGRAAIPSWSWAGWSGAIDPESFVWNPLVYMEIVKAKGGALGPNTILEVSTRFLQPAVVRHHIQQKHHFAIYVSSTTGTAGLEEEVVADKSDYRLAFVFMMPGSFHLVALILQWVPEKYTYTRIGVATLGLWKFWTKKTPEQLCEELLKGQQHEVILIE